MIKVLQLISASRIFGAERVMLNLAKHLSGQIEMFVGVMAREEKDNEVLEEARRLGLPAYWIPSRGPLDMDTFRSVKKLIRELEVDIVHSHNYKSNFYAWLCRSGRRWLATAHCWGGTDWKSRMYDGIDKVLIRFADKVVGVSLNLLDDFDKIKIPKRKQVYIPNGLDLDAPEREIDEVFTVGFIGRFEREKNIKGLISALIRFLSEKGEETRAILVGDGSLRPWAEERVKEAGLERKVLFTGKIPSSNMGDVYRKIDLLFLPSFKEGLPMVVLEALNWGIPVLGSPAALRDVGEGEFGWLIRDLRDEERMAEALDRIRKVYFEDREKYLGMVQSARSRARDFSEERMISSYRDLYYGLVGRGGGR